MQKKELETSVLLAATPEFIARRILLIKGQKVMMDSDLAELYQVPTKVLNQAVRRNIERFPSDFMFKLSLIEAATLRSQIVTSSSNYGGRRYQPHAFTELGVAMLSSVLNSDRAVQMNIFIMRAFVKLREMIATNSGLAKKIEDLEKGQVEHGKHLIVISAALKKLMDAGKPLKSAIGFEV